MENLPDVQFPAEPTPDAAPKKKPNYVLILGLTVVLPVALLVGLHFVCQSVRITDKVRPADKAVMFKAEDAAKLFEGFEPDASKGRIMKISLGNAQLTYEYNHAGTYISNSLVRDKTEQSAQAAFASMPGALKLGLRFDGKGKDYEKCPYEVSFGDQSFCEMVKGGSGFKGQLIIVRKGLLIYSLFITPYYFESAEALEAGLGPFIAQLDTFKM